MGYSLVSVPYRFTKLIEPCDLKPWGRESLDRHATYGITMIKIIGETMDFAYKRSC